MNTTTITAEFLSPHDFVHHPDNRPGGLKEDHIENLAHDMREKGFDEDYFVKYCIADETWPEEMSNLRGKRVLLGGHHRTEAAKRANITKIPAKLKQMPYEETLEFLDKDNDYSPLHWYEKGILHEKRRKALKLSPLTYAIAVLGLPATKTKGTITRATFVSQSAQIEKMIKDGIRTDDVRELSLQTVRTVCNGSPKDDWAEIFEEIRAGTLPRTDFVLVDRLNQRYQRKSGRLERYSHGYLYIASCPNTKLVKCGMTYAADARAYVRECASRTWSLDFSLHFAVPIPVKYLERADETMRDRLKGWQQFREFYNIPLKRAQAILMKIEAEFAEEGRVSKAVQDDQD